MTAGAPRTPSVFDTLRQVPLFEELDEEDLARLCRLSEEIELEHGHQLFAEGDDGDRAYVITDGEIEILKQSSGREVLLAVRRAPEVIGEVSLLEASPRNATARARGSARLLTIPKPALDQLIETSPRALRAMFDTILARLRETEAQVRQGERMQQLGTLSAGVAHELNNPAAGVSRSADLVRACVEEYGTARERLAVADLTSEGRALVDDLLSLAHHRAGRPAGLDALVCSDRESAIEDWLHDHAIPEPWDLAPALMNLEITPARLDEISAATGDVLRTVLDAVVSAHEVNSLLHQVEEGSRRISEIVQALKSYAYLDQAEVQDVDVTEGIDDTLLLLGAKLRSIAVLRQFAPNLPRIEAYGSELNQVWTNLIDNAADALERDPPAGGGVLRIRVMPAPTGDGIVVEVQDNGPGIAPGIQDRIFDRFFTTKPPGSGTGLGLDTTQRIVVLRHRGDLAVTSEPGQTVFRVTLPGRLQ